MVENMTPNRTDVRIEEKLLGKKYVTIRSVSGIEWQSRAWLLREKVTEKKSRWRIVIIRGYLKLHGVYKTRKEAFEAFEALTVLDDGL